MTIGPAPMIRIEEMSVRLGMSLGDIWATQGTKKGRAFARPSGPAQRSGPRARALFRPESLGREGQDLGKNPGKVAILMNRRGRPRDLTHIRVTAGPAAARGAVPATRQNRKLSR